MVEPLRHRQTKGAANRMSDLQPPRHTRLYRFATSPRRQPLIAQMAVLPRRGGRIRSTRSLGSWCSRLATIRPSELWSPRKSRATWRSRGCALGFAPVPLRTAEQIHSAHFSRPCARLFDFLHSVADNEASCFGLRPECHQALLPILRLWPVVVGRDQPETMMPPRR